MGKKVGIIGMGRIGLPVAKRLFTLGMHIHYHNRNRLKKNLEKKYGAVYWNELDEMLSQVDVLTPLPYTPEFFIFYQKKT